MARLRVCLEDFQVEEIPLYPPLGEGGHTFLRIEKRGRDTDAVARELARGARVPPRDVGYAGRKDRWALTVQWFSVPGLDPEEALALPLTGARVLEAARHPHKLRTGQLRANRFHLLVRDVDDEQAGRAAVHFQRLQQVGMPNRFGPQRFGRDGNNVAQARALLAGKGRPSDRRASRFLLSALQSAVFNEVLVRRPLPLDRVEEGDVAVVHASGGLFPVEDVEREGPRAERFEISATGPIFGTRVHGPTGAPADRERTVLGELGIPDLTAWRPPAGVRLRGARRALRIRPTDSELRREGDGLHLRFTLPRGSYATVLVQELFGADLAQGAPNRRMTRGACSG